MNPRTPLSLTDVSPCKSLQHFPFYLLVWINTA